MHISEMIEICTNLKNKLHSINEDLLQINESIRTNQESFEDIKSGYGAAINYLSQQYFIQNNINTFIENQTTTNQKIGVLSEQFVLLKEKIDVLVEQIESRDISSINNTIEWLESSCH